MSTNENPHPGPGGPQQIDWEARHAFLNMKVEQTTENLTAVKRRSVPLITGALIFMVGLGLPASLLTTVLFLLALAALVVSMHLSRPQLRSQLSRRRQMRSGATHLIVRRGSGALRLEPAPRHWAQKPTAELVRLISVPSCLALSILTQLLPHRGSRWCCR